MGAHPLLDEPGAAEVARMQAAVGELKPKLAAYARERGGRFVLFGSAARREMRPDSDVDIYVDFPDGIQSEAARFADNLSCSLGIRPDILSFGSPAGRFRERVEADGLVLPGDEERWSNPMTDEERWGDILDAARSAATHFRAAERIFLRSGLDDGGELAYERRMAFYHAMQSAHTSLESALKRALVGLGEQLPSGAEWHKELVRLAAQPRGPQGKRLLDSELAAAVGATLGFRHFVTHAYDVPFKDWKAQPAVEAGRFIADRIENALAEYADGLKSD